jgi:hypothetical protein
MSSLLRFHLAQSLPSWVIWVRRVIGSIARMPLRSRQASARVDHGGTTAGRAAMPPIPDFTSRDWQKSRTSGQLATGILEGKGTLMVPWYTKLTPAQARDLVLNVRNFGGPDILAAETKPATSSGPSLVEFDNRIRSLLQHFDEIEKQLQALPPASTR